MTPASMDTVVMYNNKGPDEQVGYVTHFTELATSRPPNETTGALAVVADSTTNVISDDVMLSGVSGLTTVNDDGNAATPASLMGTFHGIAGTFNCASACIITPIAGGGYTLTGAALTFTPTLGGPAADDDADALAALMATIDDPDYMWFGYWLNESSNDDGPTAMVNGIFGGTMASAANAVASLEGSAEYVGPASGLYVLETFDDRGTASATAAGQFTAMANLTAYFGGDDVSANNEDMIMGTITNFMAGGEAIDPDWSLSMTADHDGEATFSGGTRPTGADADNGAWRGGFFGEVTADDAGTTDMDETVYPSGVAGEFTGHFQNGDVLGGFGASMVEDDS